MNPCAQPGLKGIDEAIAQLQALLKRPLASESLASESLELEQATGRILAQDLRARLDRPQWDNSAMDGYALNSADLNPQNLVLPLAGCIAAGDGIQSLPPGHCLQIFTGAPLPLGADAVVPQEQCRREGDRLIFDAMTSPGANIRRRGEEQRLGEPLLSAGIRLRAQEIGLLAGQGYASLEVWRPLRLGLVSSGNELRPPGAALEPGQIYDVNAWLLASLLRGWGFEVKHYQPLRDDLEQTKAFLDSASREQDILISSGGVSVGEADCLKQAVLALGQIDLWRVAIQPGKPLAFGLLGGTPWVGLPGNPAASLITALIILRPALLAAQGLTDTAPLSLRLKAAFDWPKTKGRQQYLQARLVKVGDESWVEVHPKQGSAMLGNACWAEGLAVVPPGQAVERGQLVTFIPY